MRGAALFFLDTLVEDRGGRGLVTSPSLSPENLHPFGTSLCIGPAMDRQILRDLFAHTMRGREHPRARCVRFSKRSPRPRAASRPT